MHHDMFFEMGRPGPERGGRRHGERGPRGHGGGPLPGGVPWGGRPGPMGFGDPRGPGRGRRGDVRHALLALLAEEPRNGYQLIQAIADKTQGLWSPGPGSVYPALTLLTDEGLVAPEDDHGKKVFHLTDDGRAYMGEHADEVDEPWRRVTEGHEGLLDVRRETAQLALALKQVVMAGNPEQVKAARAIIDQARKDLYTLLAQ